MRRRFVLLHSPLIGPGVWNGVARGLRLEGHEVATLSLPALLEIEGGFYAALAAAVSSGVRQGGACVLVAHSGAGGLTPAVIAACGELISGVIFADAILPHPARTWFDTTSPSLEAQLRSTAVDDVLPPWCDWFAEGVLEALLPDDAERQAFAADLAPLPMAYFDEAAPDLRLPGGLATGYLRLSSAYDRELREAERMGWPTARLDLSHLAMMTDPEVVVTSLIDLAWDMEARRRATAR